jgi:hypothetical protein
MALHQLLKAPHWSCKKTPPQAERLKLVDPAHAKDLRFVKAIDLVEPGAGRVVAIDDWRLRAASPAEVLGSPHLSRGIPDCKG